MDRAWLVRFLVRPLLLAAMALQSLTPDLLDHTLLSQSLPPSPLFVLSSFSTGSRIESVSDEVFPEGAFALPSAGDPERDETDGPPDELCQPFWPEPGVSPSRSVGSTARQKFRVDWSHQAILRIDGASEVRLHAPALLVAELPLLLCRFLC